MRVGSASSDNGATGPASKRPARRPAGRRRRGATLVEFAVVAPLVFLLIFGLMFILGGIQLFTIGIVMELLIRTYYESQKKRPYRIKNVTIGGEVA